MKASYIQSLDVFDAEAQAERALYTLELLAEFGGTFDRWQAFILLSPTLNPIYESFAYLNLEPTPQLRFLSLRWQSNDSVADLQEADALELLGSQYLQEDPDSLEFDSNLCHLCQVELIGIPNSFLFKEFSPVVSVLSNLTNLSLIGAINLPPIQGISALLYASPQLEHLCINMSMIHWADDHMETKPIAPLRARMSSLTSFSLNVQTVQGWGLQVLQIIDAPRLQYLELAEAGPYSDTTLHPQQLYQYLSTGRLNGVLQYDIPLEGQGPSSGPIFPSLRHLAGGIQGSHFVSLLKVFPLVTQVTLNLECLEMLANHPELCPNVSHMTYRAAPSSDSTRAMLAIESVRLQANITLEIHESQPEAWVLESND